MMMSLTMIRRNENEVIHYPGDARRIQMLMMMMMIIMMMMMKDIIPHLMLINPIIVWQHVGGS
jgi:hypothetical protein